MSRAGSPFLRNFVEVPTTKLSVGSRSVSPLEPSKSIQQLIEEKRLQKQKQIETEETLQAIKESVCQLEPEPSVQEPVTLEAERNTEEEQCIENKKPVKPRKVASSASNRKTQLADDDSDCTFGELNTEMFIAQATKPFVIPAQPEKEQQNTVASETIGSWNEPSLLVNSALKAEIDTLREQTQELETELASEREQRKKLQFQLAKQRQQHAALRDECMRQVQQLTSLLK